MTQTRTYTNTWRYALYAGMLANAQENRVHKSRGILCDDMSVQEDIYMSIRGNDAECAGCVDLGNETEHAQWSIF